jgi:hypothetical protein
MVMPEKNCCVPSADARNVDVPYDSFFTNTTANSQDVSPHENHRLADSRLGSRTKEIGQCGCAL